MNRSCQHSGASCSYSGAFLVVYRYACCALITSQGLHSVSKCMLPAGFALCCCAVKFDIKLQACVAHKLIVIVDLQRPDSHAEID